jgi:hypothetical protein
MTDDNRTEAALNPFRGTASLPVLVESSLQIVAASTGAAALGDLSKAECIALSTKSYSAASLVLVGVACCRAQNPRRVNPIWPR